MPKKDQTAVMCHNIAKYNRAHQEPEITPLEAAENHAEIAETLELHAPFVGGTYRDAMFKAATDERKIAAGEYAPVVHGQWLNFYGDFATAECSECDECYEVSPDDEPREEYFSAFKQCYKHCPSCGALMDGKDDSHE